MVDLTKFFSRVLEQEQPQVPPGKRATLHLKPRDVTEAIAVSGARVVVVDSGLSVSRVVDTFPEHPSGHTLVTAPARMGKPGLIALSFQSQSQSESPSRKEPDMTAEYEQFERLLREQAALNARVEAARQQAMTAEIAGIRAKINRLGITPKQLGFQFGEAGSSAPRAPRAKGARLYRDPLTGATWSGMGRAPVWLKEVPRAERERFRVEPSPAEPDLLSATLPETGE